MAVALSPLAAALLPLANAAVFTAARAATIERQDGSGGSMAIQSLQCAYISS